MASPLPAAALRATPSTSPARRATSASVIAVGWYLAREGMALALLHRPLRVLAESVGQRRHQRRVGILTAAHRDRQHHQTGGRLGRPSQGDESETEHRELGQATVGGHRQQEYSFAGREKD